MFIPDLGRDIPEEFRQRLFSDALEQASARNRVLSFSQISRLLAPLYVKHVFNDGRPKTGRGWVRACNNATRLHLDYLDEMGKIKLITGRDYVPAFEYGCRQWYDSAKHDCLPSSSLAELFHTQLRNRPTCFDDELIVNKDEASLVEHYHGNGGNSEFTAGQLNVSEARLAFALSTDSEDWKIADTWRLNNLPTDKELYKDKYAGDALVTVAGQDITVCGPWIPQFTVGGVSTVQKFLEALDKRLKGPYWLLAPRGFPNSVLSR